MQYTTAILGFLAAATSVSAAPTVHARAADWTITNFKRTCNNANTSCTVSFGIDTHVAPVTACTYTVTGAAPVSRAAAGPVTCGAYTVTSGWSDQFGADAGFTTWSVADWSKKLIAYPSYADRDVVNGAVVKPDRSFAVNAISW
jgi:hypothetical protein